MDFFMQMCLSLYVDLFSWGVWVGENKVLLKDLLRQLSAWDYVCVFHPAGFKSKDGCDGKSIKQGRGLSELPGEEQ